MADTARGATASGSPPGMDQPGSEGGKAEAPRRPAAPGARETAGLAQPDGDGAGLGPDKGGRCAPVAPGPPPAWRRALAVAYVAFRKVAMIGPSDEELRRLEEEDRRANTEWLPGGRIGLVHGFSEFGARREDWDGK